MRSRWLFGLPSIIIVVPSAGKIYSLDPGLNIITDDGQGFALSIALASIYTIVDLITSEDKGVS